MRGPQTLLLKKYAGVTKGDERMLTEMGLVDATNLAFLPVVEWPA